MNEKLIVKNFGPIREAELDLKKVTIFIGPQGSGKSTLAKFVAICKDSHFLCDAFIGKSFTEYFTKYQANFFLNENTSFSFDTERYFSAYNKTDGFDLDIKTPKNIFFGKTSAPYTNLTLKDLKNFWQSVQERIKRGTTSMNTAFSNQVLPVLIENLNKITHKTKYLPTDRLLISSISDSILGLLSAEVALQKSTVDFGRDFEIARSKIPKLFIDYLNITYKYENGRNLVFHNETDSVPLSASASGYQSVIPLHLTVEHFAKEEDTLFIVEEPELNLYPITQKELIGYLTDRCTKGDNQLLINTHSPYVLSSLNILLFAYQVANKYPESADEVAKIVPREQWLNPDDFAAYYVGEDKNGNKGGIHSIFDRDKQTQLIGENELDEVSDELGDEFNELMNIYRTKKRETVN